MRRVYYAFALRIATHPAFGYSVLLLALGWTLKELIFFARIWESFMTVQVGELGSFLVRLVVKADTLTLVVFSVSILVGMLWLKQLSQIRLSLFRGLVSN